MSIEPDPSMILPEKDQESEDPELLGVAFDLDRRKVRINPKRKTRAWINEVRTYVTNQAKWQAAAEYCEDRGYNFRLITEKEIKPWLGKLT